MKPDLFPKLPKRLKQPKKQLLREHLVLAADALIRLGAENAQLRERLQRVADVARETEGVST